MTDDVIKQVPNILEYPIIVMDSKTKNERLTMFGEVYSQGKPILAVLELNPTDRNNVLIDEIKLASAYGKDKAQNLINNSTALYVETDKKRVNEWKKRTGLLLPVSNSYTNSNNIKAQNNNIVNTNISENETKYSLNEDSEGNKLSEEQIKRYRNIAPELRDEKGRIKPFYHGTARADRVGNYFNPNRATSGPMAFFTDNAKIAENYSRDKSDTSMAYDSDYDNYETQFRINGKPVSDYWYTLSQKEKNELTEKIQQVTLDDDENIILNADNKYGIGNFNDYELNLARGNAIRVLVDGWLNGGTLYGDESRFLEVLEAVGIKNAEYKDPNYREEKVYKVYLNVTNPFNTDNADEEFISDLEDYVAATDMSIYETENSQADMWDKNSIDIYEWIERLKDDTANGTTHAWTSIPDVVTDFLKEYGGYDGIVDKGGKNGGEVHTVVIPFYSNQIKNVDNVNPTDSEDIRYSRNGISLDMTDDERYEALKNISVKISQIDKAKITDIDIEEFERSIKSRAEKYIKPFADKLGITRVDYSNSSLDFDFSFTKKSLDKSLHSQLEYGGNYGDFVKMLSCFDDLVENAVLIEAHTDKYKGTRRENQRLKQTYVLLGAFRNEKYISPVQFEVKEYTDKQNRLYLAVNLTKIEPEVMANTALETNQVRTKLFSSSNISISDIFKKINTFDKKFLKYVPDGFLNKEQRTAKNEAIKEENEYINSLRYSLNNTKTADELVKENAELKEAVEILKREFKLTKGHKLNSKQIESMAKYYAFARPLEDFDRNIFNSQKTFSGTDLTEQNKIRAEGIYSSRLGCILSSPPDRSR